MSLHVDPHLTIKLLREGEFTPQEAEKEVHNLIAEISSGIYSLDYLGLKSLQELRGLRWRYCKEETLC